MDKLTLAHDAALAMIRSGCSLHTAIADAWAYADAMQAEADKRSKAEAEQKRKEMREMLNAPNTFIEREGQHFDDVNWQPDWSQAPSLETNYWSAEKDGRCSWWVGKPERDSENHYEGGLAENCKFYGDAPSFGYTGDWKNSLRKRPQ